MALTKQQLDEYFNDNYNSIKEYIQKSFSKNKVRNEDPDFFFSEIYIYVLDRIDDIDDTSMLKKYISTFIHNNTYWTNSQVRESEVHSRAVKNVEFIPSQYENTPSDEETQLSTDEQLNEYKAVIEMYYASLTSLEKKAVWEIYFIEGKQTVTKFAEHIKMSRSVADKFIKELKSDIRAYYEKYKTQYNISKND